MGLLDGLFGRKKAAVEEAVEPVEAPAICPHLVVVPQWDAAADIGVEDRATHYLCSTCNGRFTVEEARELRVTTAERLRIEMEETQGPQAE